jgi:hypothetical protein
MSDLAELCLLCVEVSLSGSTTGARLHRMLCLLFSCTQHERRLWQPEACAFIMPGQGLLYDYYAPLADWVTACNGNAEFLARNLLVCIPLGLPRVARCRTARQTESTILPRPP